MSFMMFKRRICGIDDVEGTVWSPALIDCRRITKQNLVE